MIHNTTQSESQYSTTTAGVNSVMNTTGTTITIRDRATTNPKSQRRVPGPAGSEVVLDV